MTPSLIVGDGNWAVKSDSLLGYKTIDGKYYPREMSVVRATTGTRVNEAGLVEVVPYNLVSWSEQFDNAYWSKGGSTIVANNITAPDGTTTADALVEDTSTGFHQIYTAPTGNANTVYTASIYVKPAGRAQISLTFSGGGFGANRTAFFGLTGNGTVDSTQASVTSASIENVGNGWYRCSVVLDLGAGSGNAFFQVMPTVALSQSYTGNGTVAAYFWGAQLVEGTQPLTYLPTTDRLDIARIDYSTGSPALLLEPQRTNLALQSSSFDSASWNINALTIAANSNTSPSGVSDADTLTGDGASAQHRVRQFINFTNALTYTVSVYVKKNTNNFFQIVLGGAAFGNAPFANFDINNGTLGSTGGGTTSTITDVGNGWYRCTMSATATVTTSDVVEFYLITSSTSIRRETNTLSTSVFLWGAQLEVGSYPTSYIPTTSATVTRNADQCVKTGASAFIGQTEGTLYFEGIAEYNTEICSINQNVQNSIFIYSLAGYGVFGYIYADGSGLSFGSLVNPLTKFKAAIAYKTNSMAMYINGNLIQEYTGFSFTPNAALTTLFIAQGGYVQGKEKVQADAVALFTTRLSNSELATLTNL